MQSNFIRIHDISLNVCGRTSRYNPDEMAWISRVTVIGGLICAVT